MAPPFPSTMLWLLVSVTGAVSLAVSGLSVSSNTTVPPGAAVIVPLLMKPATVPAVPAWTLNSLPWFTVTLAS